MRTGDGGHDERVADDDQDVDEDEDGQQQDLARFGPLDRRDHAVALGRVHRVVHLVRGGMAGTTAGEEEVCEEVPSEAGGSATVGGGGDEDQLRLPEVLLTAGGHLRKKGREKTFGIRALICSSASRRSDLKCSAKQLKKNHSWNKHQELHGIFVTVYFY